MGHEDREGSHLSDLRYPTPCHHLPPLLSLCHQHLTLNNCHSYLISTLAPLPLAADSPHWPNDLYKCKSDQATLTPQAQNSEHIHHRMKPQLCTLASEALHVLALHASRPSTSYPSFYPQASMTGSVCSGLKHLSMLCLPPGAPFARDTGWTLFSCRCLPKHHSLKWPPGPPHLTRHITHALYPLPYLILLLSPLYLTDGSSVSLPPLFLFTSTSPLPRTEPGTKWELNKYMSNEGMNDFDDAIKLMIYNPVHPSCPHHLPGTTHSWIGFYWL